MVKLGPNEPSPHLKEWVSGSFLKNMNLLSWIFFGIAISLITTVLGRNKDLTEFLGNLLLGVLGSVLGGILAVIILGNRNSPYNLAAAGLALASAVLILSLSRLVKQS